jgi:hypothetical protein
MPPAKTSIENSKNCSICLSLKCRRRKSQPTHGQPRSRSASHRVADVTTDGTTNERAIGLTNRPSNERARQGSNTAECCADASANRRTCCAAAEISCDTAYDCSSGCATSAGAAHSRNFMHG